MLTYGLHVKRNLYCRLWNWDSLQEYASQGNRASPALPGCSHSRNCPPPFEAGVSFFSVPSAKRAAGDELAGRRDLLQKSLEPLDDANRPRPSRHGADVPTRFSGGTSADRCPVYRRIHSAIDITTAYELGAD